MPTDFDSPWKEALDEFFEPFLALLFPHVHEVIDWSRGYESLDTELQQILRDADQGRKHVDKLMKVWLRDGQEKWLLIHIEVQSQEEAEFPRRMFVYQYRLFDRYNRMALSLAVLGDERPDWRPDRFAQEVYGCGLVFYFPIVKLLDYIGKRKNSKAARTRLQC
jgi:hypothetical protein